MEARARVGAAAALSLWLGLGAGSASALELLSEHYRIAPTGQAEALGFAGSSITLSTVAPGFWWIAGGGFPTLASDADLIPAYRDSCRWTFNPGDVDDLDRCSLIDSGGACDVLDVSVIERALELPPLLPGISQVCTAAAPR